MNELLHNLRDSARTFLKDPIGTSFNIGIKLVEIAIGIVTLMFFVGIARSCVGI